MAESRRLKFYKMEKTMKLKVFQLKLGRLNRSERECEFAGRLADQYAQLIGVFPSEKRGKLLLAKPFSHQVS